jgi:PAS domain S-box-containing protein
MRMRKIINLFLIVLFITTVPFASAEPLHIKVGVYQNYPLMFRSEKGTAAGFGAEVLEQVAEKEDWDIEYVFGTWSEIFDKVQSAEIDMTFPVGFTLERTEIVQYNSENVVSNWGQVYLRDGVRANSILDLNGLTIAVLRDDIYYTGKYGMKYLAGAFNLDVKYYVADNYGEVLEALNHGYADAGLVNRFFGMSNSSKYNVEKSTILIHPVEVRFAFPMNNAKSFKIIAKLDPYIKEMKHQENSAYYNSYLKWIGGAQKPGYFKTAKMLLAILLIPGLVIILIIFLMRSEIRRKTKELTQKNHELQKEIEEREKVQLELKESQEKYSTLFNTSYNPIAIIGEDGSIVDVNGEMVTQFGYEREELHRMFLEMLVTNDYVHKVKEIINKMTKTKKWSFDLDFVKSWGDVFNAEISASRLEISGQTYIQLVIMDVTSRRKASELLNRRQEYLENKVEQEVHRRRQNERLMMQQSKMAAMGQMMSAIAHQWRQPLNTIAICIQDFEDSFKHGELDEKYLQELVGLSMKQINFMSKTIDDFKNFFRPDKDERVFEVCSETLSAVTLLGVQLVRNNIKLLLNCHGTKIPFENAEEFKCRNDKCTFIKGFPNEFKQVLLNLVQNARDAVEDSRKDKSEEMVIEVGVEELETSVKIFVCDNGDGIPDDVAERIFEPYFTTKEEGRGTGVGLYMSKIIIEQNMKGLLYFENLNPGTRFVIELKRHRDPSNLIGIESDSEQPQTENQE